MISLRLSLKYAYHTSTFHHVGLTLLQQPIKRSYNACRRRNFEPSLDAVGIYKFLYEC
jgi:hypothetical protein